jgi:hypothetical protein
MLEEERLLLTESALVRFVGEGAFGTSLAWMP